MGMNETFWIRAFILTGLAASAAVAADLPATGKVSIMIWLWICILAYETLRYSSEKLDALRRSGNTLGEVGGELLYPLVGILSFFLSPLLFIYAYELIEKFADCVKIIAIGNGL